MTVLPAAAFCRIRAGEDWAGAELGEGLFSDDKMVSDIPTELIGI